ncbi:hypothetical protein KM043_005841 [Ampulex compressa]|nr:hypothetical protein KM043_005841 [Ampulex compressa]
MIKMALYSPLKMEPRELHLKTANGEKRLESMQNRGASIVLARRLLVLNTRLENDQEGDSSLLIRGWRMARMQFLRVIVQPLISDASSLIRALVVGGALDARAFSIPILRGCWKTKDKESRGERGSKRVRGN